MSDPKEQSAHSEPDDSLSPLGEHIEEEVTPSGKRIRARGVYLLPNLLTTSALFCGFYAIISAMNGHFENAAIAIFAGMVFDGLDGRVARLTNTQSAFGVEYDSLSDVVTFGAAPALVAFNWALHNLGKWGWAAAFLYLACAALRLARFNTHVGSDDKRFFTGLASPPAAALIASMVWTGHDSVPGYPLSVLAALVTALAGVLMVLNLRYHSFKGINFHGRVPFAAALFIVLLFVVISIDPPRVLLLLASVYALSGPVAYLGQRLVALRGKKA